MKSTREIKSEREKKVREEFCAVYRTVKFCVIGEKNKSARDWILIEIEHKMKNLLFF
jgi:hydrogenase maturation factor